MRAWEREEARGYGIEVEKGTKNRAFVRECHERVVIIVASSWFHRSLELPPSCKTDRGGRKTSWRLSSTHLLSPSLPMQSEQSTRHVAHLLRCC